MSQVSLVAFSLMMLPVIAYVQPDDSPAREPVPHRSGAAVNHLSNDIYVNSERAGEQPRL